MTTELFVEPDTLAPADRSILETAAECPRQARFIETGRVIHVTFPMESGNGFHQAASETITEYVESRGQVSFDDTKEYFLQRLAASRPDIQPDVIKAGERCAYSFAKYLHNLHFENIRCWDGGRGEHSSQLAYDLPEFGLRITSELDLLHDSESEEVIAILDFKSGYAKWDHADVKESFQFGLHALLGLKRFPDVKAVQISVYNTRINQITYPVLFKRESIYNLEFRVRNAAMAYFKTRDKEPEACEAWPMVEKCSLCPAAALCDCTKFPEGTPEEWVDKIVALESQASALSTLAANHVKKSGRDIETKLGNWYGANAPKRSVAARMKSYSIPKKPVTETPTEGATE